MKVLILSNYGMGLYKFRRELLEELVDQKYNVYISLPFDEYAPVLEKIGCKFIDTPLDRRGANPFKDLKLLVNYLKMIKQIKPDVVLTYTIKPNIYGGLACRVLSVPYIANITGLGTSIENKGILQKVTLFLYKVALKKARCVFFQNQSNLSFFMKNNIINSKTRLLPGSGVNLQQYKWTDYLNNDETIKLLFIGRIMKAKGINELLEAIKRVKAEYPNIELGLIGGYEEEYEHIIQLYEQEGLLTYYGQQDDVQSYIQNSHAIIHPSHHEGMSNVLLESAAIGRPVLASNIPGCMEAFDEGVSGFGFEPKNIDSLVDTIVSFIHTPYEQKKAMGLAARKKMEREFDRTIVLDAYIEEMEQILNK